MNKKKIACIAVASVIGAGALATGVTYGAKAVKSLNYSKEILSALNNTLASESVEIDLTIGSKYGHDANRPGKGSTYKYVLGQDYTACYMHTFKYDYYSVKNSKKISEINEREFNTSDIVVKKPDGTLERSYGFGYLHNKNEILEELISYLGEDSPLDIKIHWEKTRNGEYISKYKYGGYATFNADGRYLYNSGSIKLTIEDDKLKSVSINDEFKDKYVNSADEYNFTYLTKEQYDVAFTELENVIIKYDKLKEYSTGKDSLPSLSID